MKTKWKGKDLQLIPFIDTKLSTSTAQNIEILRNFLVWKFCEIAQFPQSFGRFARNSAETAPFHRIPHQEIRCNYGVLCSVVKKGLCERYFIEKFVKRFKTDILKNTREEYQAANTGFIHSTFLLILFL